MSIVLGFEPKTDESIPDRGNRYLAPILTDQLWGPPSPLFRLYKRIFFRRQRFWCVKLATHLCLTPRLRMSGALPLVLRYVIFADTGTALSCVFYPWLCRFLFCLPTLCAVISDLGWRCAWRVWPMWRTNLPHYCDVVLQPQSYCRLLALFCSLIPRLPVTCCAIFFTLHIGSLQWTACLP